LRRKQTLEGAGPYDQQDDGADGETSCELFQTDVIAKEEV